MRESGRRVLMKNGLIFSSFLQITGGHTHWLHFLPTTGNKQKDDVETFVFVLSLLSEISIISHPSHFEVGLQEKYIH